MLQFARVILKFRPIVLTVSTLVSKTKSPGSNPGGPAMNVGEST
jgi:hypothetical protein